MERPSRKEITEFTDNVRQVFELSSTKKLLDVSEVNKATKGYCGFTLILNNGQKYQFRLFILDEEEE